MQIKGHDNNIRMLKKLFADDNASGSYLFTGMDSIGKKAVALWFARLINCPDPDPPCGVCVSCSKIEGGIHPDVKLIARYEDKKAILVDQIRDQLISESSYRPLEGRFKVFMIDSAHLMNDQAQNALLKVMEEPGSTTVIILITSRPAEIIDTIRSRCRIYRFFPLPVEDVEEIIRACPDVPSERVALVSQTSYGSPGRAIKQAGNEQFWAMRQGLYNLMAKLPDGSLGDVLEYCNKFWLERSDVEGLESMFEIILAWLRDIICLKEGLDRDSLINPDFYDSLQGVEYCYSEGDILNLQEQIMEIRKLMFENNLNIRMGLQRIMIKVKQMGSV